ncbi:hypothetical protein CAPGI0001_0393 [Capnocytophaga gingivalis ATCC 33624]|nr:hypothetical protein CAPGI0001_0393 [Capnocytophaga gingivalis ATCC 33624]
MKNEKYFLYSKSFVTPKFLHLLKISLSETCQISTFFFF